LIAICFHWICVYVFLLLAITTFNQFLFETFLLKLISNKELRTQLLLTFNVISFCLQQNLNPVIGHLCANQSSFTKMNKQTKPLFQMVYRLQHQQCY